MNQQTLFDDARPVPEPTPVDPSVDEEDVKRLKGQAGLIWEMLQRDGEVSKRDLIWNHGVERVAARIHDICKWLGVDADYFIREKRGKDFVYRVRNDD